jgi:hypothetical protein
LSRVASIVGESVDLHSPREGRYWDAEARMFAKPWDNGKIFSWHTALDKAL